MRLLICAGGTGGGVYPALAVLERLNVEYPDVQTLWVGSDNGMEAELVNKAAVPFETIPAAGIHGIGLRRIPGNIFQVSKGVMASRKLLKRYQPDLMFFTGGYVAVPMAIAGMHIPTILFVPDIEPGLALKFLAFLADKIAVTVSESKIFFSDKKNVTVTGYPVRQELTSWNVDDAYEIFGFSPEFPTLLVTGGSLGSLTINRALVSGLPSLLENMQVIHLTGKYTWPQFSGVKNELKPEISSRYQSYPYLHEEMGAALSIADLVVSRAGASSIGEYPHFGIPAVLVPYPHSWRYQKVNAEYLFQNHAAIIINDIDLPSKLMPIITDLMGDTKKRKEMKAAISSMARKDSAKNLAKLIYDNAAN